MEKDVICSLNNEDRGDSHGHKARTRITREKLKGLLAAELTSIEKKQLLNLLLGFGDIFFSFNGKMGMPRCSTVKHKIDIGDSAQIKKRSCRISVTERHVIENELQRMLKEALIQHLESPWKLKYLSTIEERFYEPHPTEAIEWKSGKKLTVVAVVIRDLEGTVISQDPIYSSGNLYSNIGGLIGCWLGISVWTFVNITERTILITINWMKKFKKKKQEIFDEALFYPTHLNFYHK
ncbi:uncharacterized protein TNIN_74891 [Trichonephila inaurata madagascariensis]|uniref:Uncharacterized protein n=1 Tax=Trichonephila inaurata madagascariensis TaxID=2747483 RepID=A0A8X6WQE5_9ARAC|nr:uncharacterized protein TNIN_74891 [Trichonephila inaurata madagascariensis]